MCLAQFARPNEEQWSKPQRALNYESSPESLNRTQQLRNCFRFGDRCEVNVLRWRKRAAKISAWIAHRTPGRDGIPKHLSAVLEGAVSRIERATCFDSTKHRKHLGRG